jgi:hypothetical protein
MRWFYNKSCPEKPIPCDETSRSDLFQWEREYGKQMDRLVHVVPHHKAGCLIELLFYARDMREDLKDLYPNLYHPKTFGSSDLLFSASCIFCDSKIWKVDLENRSKIKLNAYDNPYEIWGIYLMFFDSYYDASDQVTMFVRMADYALKTKDWRIFDEAWKTCKR